MSLAPIDQLVSNRASPLLGTIPIPGDKSISHRSLIFGSLAIGTTKVRGLLEGTDVMSTKDALVALGVEINRDNDGLWHIVGVGLNGMISPAAPLDLGNSGTGVRLLMGVVAGQKITATFCGDASLSSRPMARITDPLAKMGAKINDFSYIFETGENAPDTMFSHINRGSGHAKSHENQPQIHVKSRLGKGMQKTWKMTPKGTQNGCQNQQKSDKYRKKCMPRIRLKFETSKIDF